MCSSTLTPYCLEKGPEHCRFQKIILSSHNNFNFFTSYQETVFPSSTMAKSNIGVVFHMVNSLL